MSRNLKYILTGLGFIFLAFIFWYFKSIVAYIIVSAVLALIGNPLVDLISRIKIKKYNIPRALSAGITLAVIWTVIFTFFRIFIPLIANQASELSTIDSDKIIIVCKGQIHHKEVNI